MVPVDHMLLWVAIHGRSSWASAFITMLDAMFAVAATIGALIGTWLGKGRFESGDEVAKYRSRA